MAYSALTTKSDGDVFTAEMWNQIKDNFDSLQATILTPVPVGTMFPFAGADAPSGYLVCDGSAVSRTTYATLFDTIGTTYGSGNGSTTFNVPDLRGRFPMGAGTGTGLNASGTGAPSGTSQTARTRGAWGGEETHLLTSGESGLPSHTHDSAVGSGFVNITSGAKNLSTTGSNESITTSSATKAVPAANASSRHNTVPPFVVTNYIIKT